MTVVRRPRLVPGVRLVEQRMKDEQSFVAKSPATGAYLRFREVEARVMRLFDGEHTVAGVVQALSDAGIAVSAATVDAFATRLASLGLVERTLQERSSAQLERLRQERKGRRRQPLFRGELLRMRFSVGDPDALLTRTMPYVRWCFTPAFVYASVALFAVYAIVMIAYWSDLSTAFGNLTRPSSLTVGTGLLFWATFLVVGAVHELGHAYACKNFKGEVNEMGVMILYFQPAFYCNVNDAWSFQKLAHRMWVTVAGGWIELWLGAFAAFVWIAAAPGTLLANTALMMTVLAGGLTLLSNANPLLPYDGYFALSDWLEIPNLRQRASAYFRWYLSAHLLRSVAEEPVVTPRERRIFLTYGALSLVYVMFMYYLLSTIALGWVWRTFGGVAAALVLLAFVVLRRDKLRTLYHNVRTAIGEFYRSSLRAGVQRVVPAPLRGRRGGLAVAALVLVLPWPRNVDGRWVALPASHMQVVAPMDGVITDVLVHEGDTVRAGVPVVQMVSRVLDRMDPVRRGERDSLQLLAQAARSASAGDAALYEAEARSASARAIATTVARDAGTVRAAGDGVILTPHAERLLGGAVRAGTPLLSIGAADSLDVRIRLSGGGSSAAEAGQPVSLLLDADAANPRHGRLLHVSPTAGDANPGAIEATVRLATGGAWRAGARGDARVRVGRSTVGGALLWALRVRLRPDLLL